MVKGFFFDLFGTLLIYHDMQKAWESWLLAFFKRFKKCGLNISQKSFSLKCDGFLSKNEPKIDKQHLTVYEKRIYALGLDLGLSLECEELTKIANESINAWQKHVPLDPEVYLVLETLKKSKKVALISNFDHPPYIYSLLTDLKLIHFFDSITISSEVGFKKPNPLIFSFALKQSNLQPSEVCYIGDTNEDMEATCNAKIFPILIQRSTNAKYGIIDDFSLEEPSSNQIQPEIDNKYAKKIGSLKDLIELVS